MAELARRYAGIAWTAAGFEVAVLDDAGQLVLPPARFGPGQGGELTRYLTGLAVAGPVLAVLDSTNGVLDGTLQAAGLPVYRADPWLLPGRPLLGSVPARALAEAARHDLAALRRLTTQGGTLTGRGAENQAAIAASRAQASALAGTGRLARHGRRPVLGGADPAGLAGPAPQVALTFDDGPNPPYTGQILGILARYQVSATFFCVGLQASAHPADVARMADAGHGLGNHTWSHPFLPDLSRAQLAEQLDRTDEAVSRAAGRAAGGSGPGLFRPPYGARSPDVLRWLGERGTPILLWDVDPSDWARPGAAVIAGRVLMQARPGTIILMHDGGGNRSQTVAALPLVIEGLLDRGFRFTRADTLLAAAR